MVKHTLKILQQMLQDFKSVSDHFTTLQSKGLLHASFSNKSQIIPCATSATFLFAWRFMRLTYFCWRIKNGNRRIKTLCKNIKRLKAMNYFRKKLHPRYLTRFWIRHYEKKLFWNISQNLQMSSIKKVWQGSISAINSRSHKFFTQCFNKIW